MYITITTRQAPPKQMKFDDLFAALVTTDWTQDGAALPPGPGSRAVHTMTYKTDTLPPKLKSFCNVSHKVYYLEQFWSRWGYLSDELPKHYQRFYIPKKSGGYREINAPDTALSTCLRELADLLRTQFQASHHTAAYAYVEGRSTIDAVKVHQWNKSKWFLKTDLSGFFPSTTLDFTMRMLAQIYPFNFVMQDKRGEELLRSALSLCFLNGGLPMGTPISPMLTNLIMVPFDYEFSKYLRERQKPENNPDGKGRRFAYTRYADDMFVSCGIGFWYSDVLNKMRSLFREFGAPYIIKREKTHYGSSSGKNWILGTMLNEDNQITVGHKRKRDFEAMLHNYAKDYKEGKRWEYGAATYLRGLISYYTMVNEKDTENIVSHYGHRYGVDILEALKSDLSCA